MSDDEALANGNSDGAQETSRPLFKLEFVNVNVASEEEKRRNQKVIRSTAMRSFRRKQSQQKLKEKDGRSKVVINNNKSLISTSIRDLSLDAPDQSLQSPQSTSDISEATFLEVSRLLNGSPFSINCNELSGLEWPSPTGTLSRPSSRAMSIASSPSTLLGAGRIDPFRIQPVDVSSNMNELIDHSATILWPGFRPRRSNGSASKISSAWLETLYQRPVVMHAMLFGAAVHMDVLRSPRLSLDNPIRLFHKVQTMRLLKEELKSARQTALDGVILAVLALGTNEVETIANHMKEKPQSPFISPLASTQWLDVYGTITHMPQHTVPLRSLVARRGGLENIELEGLAEVLLFSDILGATQRLSKPYWPLLSRTVRSTEDIPKFPFRSLGQGFQDLLAFGINEDTASVLQAMGDLTAVIDCHCRGIKPISNLTILIDRRNVVQHRLMSLPKGDELNYGEVSSVCLYESIRNAAITFSVAVTFPLPPLMGIFRKLASVLKDVLEESKFDPCWQLCPKTLLWILILGGIAALGTMERTWYVQNLVAVSAALGLSNWEEVLDELENYLWLNSACEAGGRMLWLEVMNDGLIQECDGAGFPCI